MPVYAVVKFEREDSHIPPDNCTCCPLWHDLDNECVAAHKIKTCGVGIPEDCPIVEWKAFDEVAS